ncbi:hypothetical protein F5887DRAFT_924181 [Amanita rubescens]|nr:hypothetical protein F5887DRAFT_924181 [Amanita rubescens]
MARRRARRSTEEQDPPIGESVQEDTAYDCDTEATQAKELTRGQKAALTRKRNQMAQMMGDLESETTGPRHAKTNALNKAIWMEAQGPSRKRATPPASPQKKQKTKRRKSDKLKPPAFQLQARTHQPPDIEAESDASDKKVRKLTNTEKKLASAGVVRASVKASEHPGSGKKVASAAASVKAFERTSGKKVASAGAVRASVKVPECPAQKNITSAAGVNTLDDDENRDDSDTEDDESVTESDSYGSMVEKSMKKTAKMLTDKDETGGDQEDSETEDDTSSVTESDVVESTVKNMKALKRMTDERPIFPKDKDATSLATVASANTGEGTVAVVVRKRVVHVLDDSCTTDKDSGTPSAVPKARPLFKVPPVRSTAASPAAQTSRSTVTTVDPSDSLWPDYACLALGHKGGIGIRLQKPELAVIIRSAIHKIISWILFKDSFPTLLTRAIWNRDALAEASKEFMDCARGPLKECYEVIRRRISVDPTFVNRIGRLPDARISLYRGDFKALCVQIVKTSYNLGEGRAEVVADLFKENKYIYPLSSRGLVIGHKPFEHPAIVEVIKQRLFDDPRESITEEFPEYFKDGELAPSLIAFAATTMHAAIQEWSTGRRICQDFQATVYSDVYLCHMALLNEISKKNPGGYKHLLRRLFRTVSCRIFGHI